MEDKENIVESLKTPHRKLQTGLTAELRGSRHKRKTPLLDEDDDDGLLDILTPSAKGNADDAESPFQGKQLFGFQRRKKSLTAVLASVSATASPTGASAIASASASASSASGRPRRLATRTPEVVRSQKRLKAQKRLKTVIEASSDSSVESSVGSSDGDDCVTESNKEEEEEQDDAVASGLEIASYSRFFKDLHASKSSTSNNTLSKLPALDPKEFVNALSRVAGKHTAEKDRLNALHRQRFPQWVAELNAGFNILLYGFGSKRELLQDFAKTHLNDAPVVVINGFFPTITLKDIVGRILCDALDLPNASGSVQDQSAMILAYFSQQKRSVDKLYLVVHNIDGGNLRNDKAQTGLSQLADCPAITMLASIDHINASMLWDNTKLTCFNWLWEDATTFQSYLVETSFENSLMLQQNELGPQGVIYVLRSLTANARKIFRILAEHQIHQVEPDDKSQTENERHNAMMSRALTFQSFYQRANESFLVNNELTFRTQLTEFRDHKIIRTRKGVDGMEIMFIPLDVSILKDLLEQIEW